MKNYSIHIKSVNLVDFDKIFQRKTRPILYPILLLKGNIFQINAWELESFRQFLSVPFWNWGRNLYSFWIIFISNYPAGRNVPRLCLRSLGRKPSWTAVKRWTAIEWNAIQRSIKITGSEGRFEITVIVQGHLSNQVFLLIIYNFWRY